MKKLLILVLVALVCSSLGPVVDAASFECNDEPEACKAKFKTEFLKEFKSIFLKGSRDVMTAYIETARTILAEIADDNPFKKRLEGAVNSVDGCRKKLNENDIDENDIKDILKEAVDFMIFEALMDIPSEELEELMLKHNLRKAVTHVVERTAYEISDLWFEMFEGLREKDLEAYPEYKMIKDNFKASKTETYKSKKENNFVEALKMLYLKFDIPLFEMFTKSPEQK